MQELGLGDYNDVCASPYIGVGQQGIGDRHSQWRGGLSSLQISHFSRVAILASG